MGKILIVGASSGIGLALAERLIGMDFEVISMSRTKPNLPLHEHIEGLVRSLAAELSPRTLPGSPGRSCRWTEECQA